ncbi:hypothetical protein [Vandammella animalimorsus]|nr:hypothetical protein [Vandammella animalimorsus]
MTPLNTGRVKIGLAFERRAMPRVDERWQTILLTQPKPPLLRRLFFWSKK